MLKFLPCHINDSTLSRASVPFGVFEERKSRRTAIRADTRAMPSDSCNSEECWYLILRREREKEQESEKWCLEKRKTDREGGKKIKSPLENVPIITEALQQLSWPKIDWIESSLGILWRELLATRVVWRTFLQILLCLFWQFRQTRNISVSVSNVAWNIVCNKRWWACFASWWIGDGLRARTPCASESYGFFSPAAWGKQISSYAHKCKKAVFFIYV